jgi:hypothetical protein
VEMHQVRHSTLVNASATYTFMFGTRISRIESVSEVDTWCAGMRHLQPGKSLRGAVETMSGDASFLGIHLLPCILVQQKELGYGSRKAMFLYLYQAKRF